MKEALKNYIVLFLSLITGKFSEENLKYITTSFAAKKFHYGYEYIIKKYDPTISFHVSKTSKKKFVGKGFGSDSLNSYRKVYEGKTQYFEKIYIAHSNDFENAIAVSKIINKCNSLIHIPRLLHIQYGKKLNIVYYEFLDIKVIPTEEKFMKTVHDTQLALLNIIINESYEFDILTKMNNVKYLKDGYYLLKQKKVLESESLIFFHKLLEGMAILLRSYQHMDLCKGNVGQNNIILDWDASGEYIFGIDIAFAITELAITYNIHVDQKIIDGYIKLFYPLIKEKCSYPYFMYWIYFLYLIIKIQRCSSKKLELSKYDLTIAQFLNSCSFKYV